MAGGWRRLHSEELYNLYASPDIRVAGMGEMRNVYRILVGKPEGKRLLGRPRHRQEDSFRMGLKEVGWEDSSCSR
jgi:hypothetical protein